MLAPPDVATLQFQAFTFPGALMKYNKWLTTRGQLMDEESQKQGTALNTRVTATGLAWQRGFRTLMAAVTTAVMVAGISACSSHYMIKATDGTVYHTQGAPTLERGAYRFVDTEGNQQQLYLSKVSQVEKR